MIVFMIVFTATMAMILAYSPPITLHVISSTPEIKAIRHITVGTRDENEL